MQYVEDETEEDVLLDNMWLQKKKFKKGQKVEAQFPDDGEWYSATVKEMVSSGKYLVEHLGPASSQATCKAGERRQQISARLVLPMQHLFRLSLNSNSKVAYRCNHLYISSGGKIQMEAIRKVSWSWTTFRYPGSHPLRVLQSI